MGGTEKPAHVVRTHTDHRAPTGDGIRYVLSDGRDVDQQKLRDILVDAPAGKFGGT